MAIGGNRSSGISYSKLRTRRNYLRMSLTVTEGQVTGIQGEAYTDCFRVAFF